MKKQSSAVTSLQYGSAQELKFSNGLTFRKDAPHAEVFYSYTVVNADGDLVEAGSANNLDDLRKAAKEIKGAK